MPSCPICGRPVPTHEGRGRQAIYCSPAHRQAAYVRRHPLGERIFREAGLPYPRSLLAELRQAGVEPF